MKFHALLAGAAVAVASVPAVAIAEEPAVDGPALDAVPEPRHPPSSIRWKLFAGGVVLTGGAYAISFGSATGWPTVPGADALKIPVVGPWIALGQSGCASDDPGCGAKVVLRGILYVLDGLVQIGGLGLIGEGIFQTTESTSERKPGLARRAPAAGFTWRPVPLVSPQITGVGFTGSF